MVLVVGIYIIFFQASISYISDYTYFNIYAGKQLIKHPWFRSLISTYGFSPEAGPFHIKQKAYFLVKKTYKRFLKENFAGHGEINFSSIIKILQSKSPDNKILKSEQIFQKQFVPFNIYLTHNLQYILFSVDISDITYVQAPFTNDMLRDSYASTQGFILIFKTNKPLESFERQIKEYLAFALPSEKTIVLPDGSTFIEKLADINVFDFKDVVVENKNIRYWKYEDRHIVLWKDNNNIFISNSLDIISNVDAMCFSNIKDKKFEQAVYIEINKYDIEDVVIFETDKQLKGCMKLKRNE